MFVEPTMQDISCVPRANIELTYQLKKIKLVEHKF